MSDTKDSIADGAAKHDGQHGGGEFVAVKVALDAVGAAAILGQDADVALRQVQVARKKHLDHMRGLSAVINRQAFFGRIEGRNNRPRL